MIRKTMIAAVLFFNGMLQAQTLTIGKTVSTVKIQNPDNSPANIPAIGQKVVALFYTDPDVKDINEPLTEAIKAKKYSPDKYVGVGIANMADTWLPNSVVRYVGRQKQAKYPASVIMCDDNHILSKAWGLGDCDDAGYLIIIGKDSKVKFIKAVKSTEDSKAIISSVLALIESDLK
jgi:predicted transcriptional regulator